MATKIVWLQELIDAIDKQQEAEMVDLICFDDEKLENLYSFADTFISTLEPTFDLISIDDEEQHLYSSADTFISTVEQEDPYFFADSFISTDNIPCPHDEEQEDPNSYCVGGYHSVEIGETYNNRYTIVRKLGWGFFSTVWLSWDHLEKQFKALKILKSASGVTQKALDEIELLKCTGHFDAPQVVHLLDTFLISGVNGIHVCMVFEPLGENLLKLTRQSGYKGIPLESVKSIVRQVLEALDYLHTTCKIIHTDIKLENVCVDKSKIRRLASEKWQNFAEYGSDSPDTFHVPVAIADLGNACFVDRHFCDVIQTPPYRSPEVILGVGYGTSADIWSTACMAFELATGDYLFPPYCGDNFLSEDDNRLALMVELLGDIPKPMAFWNKYSRTFFNEKGKLRHFPHLKSAELCKVLSEEYNWDAVEARQFADFLLPMLALDPSCRSSAKESLRHEWLQHV